MGRIKIELPEKLPFTTELQLRISDINYGGHLGNDAVLTIAHEARIRFLNALHYSEKNIEGLGIIMTDAAVLYKSEGFYGDMLQIKMGIADITRVGFTLIYVMENKNTKAEIARVNTSLVFFNYDIRKVSEVPQGFLEAVKSYT
ncbi:MAG: thioesterase family protein [Bacteroidales bacterium]|nr:thioesterase family protein [Bacteroidales bacterium]